MARSYLLFANNLAVGSNSYPQISAQFATAAGAARMRVFEFDIGQGQSAPSDYSSEYTIVRTATAVVSGGTSTVPTQTDAGDTAAGASGIIANTGSTTMTQTVVFGVSVNMRATFRWVAAPTKEIVIPSAQYSGVGLNVAYQSTAYNTVVTLFWEES